MTLPQVETEVYGTNAKAGHSAENQQSTSVYTIREGVYFRQLSVTFVYLYCRLSIRINKACLAGTASF